MVRFVFRWAFRLLILLIVLLAVGLLLKDEILRQAALHVLHSRTGMDAKIGRLQVGWDGTVTMDDFVLYNTPEFGGGPFLDLPDLHVRYDTDALRAGRLRLKLLRLNLREMAIVQNAKGQTNTTMLLGAAGASASSKIKTDQGDLVFDGIDTLNLSLGKIRLEYLGDPKMNRVLELDFRNVTATNLRTTNDFNALVIKLALQKGLTFMLGGGFPSLEKPGPGGGVRR